MTTIAMNPATSQAEWTYQRIAKAIRFLDEHQAHQPDLAALADHVGLSPDHLQRVFTDWAGLSPKRFLQQLTATALKQRIRAVPNLWDAAEAVGLQSPQRVYDLFVALEAMPPQVYRDHGRGLTVYHGQGDTPFGQAVIAWTDRGITDLQFGGEQPAQVAAGIRQQWHAATWVEKPEVAANLLQQAFRRPNAGQGPLRLWVAGTAFQLKVWQALLNIPEGQLTTYGHLATALGQPQAAQAVGNAVGSNPVGWLIPCHRVIRGTGAITGYRWGSDRKRVMLGYEGALTQVA